MLSDIKGEVENVIKSGRKMVEDNSVADPEQYTFRLDTLKHLYNKVTTFYTNINYTISYY
jgi:uncharacterized Fe-S cluster-containing radical SAM superfamily protein